MNAARTHANELQARGELPDALGAALARASLSERQAIAVQARLGWDGRGAATLAAAARPARYTRERVRQLELLLARSADDSPSLRRVLASALRVVEAAAPAPRAAAARALQEAGLTSSPFDPSGVLSAARLLGIEPRVELVDGAVFARGQRAALAAVEQAALAAIRQNAAVSSAAVAARTRLVENQVDALLLVSRRVVPLGDAWFAAPDRPDRVQRRLKKVVALVGSLPIAELAAALWRGRHLRPLPLDVLAELCDRVAWLAYDRGAGRVSATPPLDPATVLTPHEQAVVALLRRHGPVSFTDVHRLAAAFGVLPTTAALIVRYSPLASPAPGGRWVLVGHGQECASPKAHAPAA